MQTYVALIRGVNLAGRNKVSMADLRRLFVGLGHEAVTTYLQSGNVVFRSRSARRDLVETLEKEIERDLGRGVTVVLRTKAQLAKVLSGNPFVENGKEPSKLHVTFLAAAPERGRVRVLDRGYGNPDEFRIVGSEVYLHCPNGYGRTKLNNAYFEKQLGVAATTRNWKTVTKLRELASGSL